MPPVAEVKNLLGQQQMGEPLYAMEREIPVAYGGGGGGAGGGGSFVVVGGPR